MTSTTSGRRIPLAPGRGLADPRARHAAVPVAGLVARRRTARARRRRATPTSWSGRPSVASLAGFIGPDGRLGPLDDPPHRRRLRGAPRRRSWSARSCVPEAAPRPALPGDGRGRRSARGTTSSCSTAFDDRSSATTCWSSGCSSWGSSMFASYAAFGHRRPLNAVLLIGVLLVANMVADRPRPARRTSSCTRWPRCSCSSGSTRSTSRPTGCAAGSATRRRSPALYLRGGTVFIVGAVARLAAPDERRGRRHRWPAPGPTSAAGSSSGRSSIERFLPRGGPAARSAPSFGSSATIRGVVDDRQRPGPDGPTVADERVRAVPGGGLYDHVRRCTAGRSSHDDRPCDARPATSCSMARATRVAPEPAVRTSIVDDHAERRRVARSSSRTRPRCRSIESATVRLVGDGRLPRAARAGRRRNAPYTGHLASSAADEEDGGPTEERLRAAGQDYPAGDRRRTTAGDGARRDDRAGGARALLDGSSAAAGRRTRTTSPPDDRARLRGRRPIQLRHERPATSTATTCRSSSASRRPSAATASTTRRRWPSCCASRASRPASSRASCRASATGRAVVDGPQQRRPRLGPGLLPGLRLGRLRPDRRRACRASRRCRPGSRSPSSAAPGPSARRAAGPAVRTDAEPSDTGPAVGGTGGGRTAGGRSSPIALLLAVDRRRRSRSSPGGAAARPGQRRRRLRHGHPARRAVRVRAAARRRPSTSTPGRSAEVLPDVRPELETVARAKVEVAYGGASLGDDRLAGPARRPTPAADEPRCASPSAATSAGAGAAGRAAEPRRRRAARARRSGCAPPGLAGRLVEQRRRGGRSGCGARSDRPAGAELDDRDRAQVHRPHPEPLERQVEQGQQQDLEDAVVADDDRPRVGRARRRRSPAPGRGRGCPGRRRGELAEEPAQGRPDPSRDLGERLAAGRPGLGRSAPPGRELGRRSEPRSRRGGGPPTAPWPISRNPSSGADAATPTSMPVGRRDRRRRSSASRGPAANGRSPAAGRPGSAGPAGRAGAPAGAATSAAWRRPRAVSGVSAWPWNRPSTMYSRLAVADEDERRVEAGPGSSATAAAQRSPPEADRPQLEDGLLAADRLLDRGRDVVVEGEDHQGVLARSRPGQVHRADVHVGLAEHRPDPPDHARPVRVAGDEHDVGRLHVEPVVAEAGDPRLAAGDRARRRSWCGRRGRRPTA